MAKIQRDQWLVPTIIDRLSDDATGRFASPHGQGLNLRGFKESVRRDLENLLNTRRRLTPWPADFDELDRSLFNYGIPDSTGINASSTDDVHQFLRSIEEVIRHFEPRFKSVRVLLSPSDSDEDRVLRFQIEGLLRAEPTPEPVAYATEMEPGTGAFAVQSAG